MSTCFVTAVLEERGERDKIDDNAHVEDYSEFEPLDQVRG